MPGNNGHISGNHTFGNTSIDVLTSREIVKIIPTAQPTQKGKKLEFTGFKPGTDEKIVIIGHPIKN